MSQRCLSGAASRLILPRDLDLAVRIIAPKKMRYPANLLNSAGAIGREKAEKIH